MNTSTQNKKSVILTDGSTLYVKEVGGDFEDENGKGYYRAFVSSDKSNDGFEGDRGLIKEGETIESITNEIEMWMEDNLNDDLLRRQKHNEL